MPTETAKIELANFLNYYLSIDTLIGFVVVVLWLGVLIYGHYRPLKSKILDWVSKYVLPIGFFSALGGTFLTLFYSQYLGYEPCELCWFQRIFLYPSVFLFAYAWYKKDRHILPYVALLSFVGGAIALYHHALQMGYDLYKPCSGAIFAVSCSKPSFIEFGFVSFPFMAVVLFGFLIALCWTGSRK
jgi:disulfide bond formation protein DsbB